MAFLESSLPLSLDISVYKLHFDFYINETFIGRTYLAAIDHNTHVFLKNAVSAVVNLNTTKFTVNVRRIIGLCLSKIRKRMTFGAH